MAKKYQPSGYQIINLDLQDSLDGVEFTIPKNTDDEKLFYELCETGKIINKPLLIQLNNVAETTNSLVAFVSIIEINALGLKSYEFAVPKVSASRYDVSPFYYDAESDTIKIQIVEI